MYALRQNLKYTIYSSRLMYLVRLYCSFKKFIGIFFTFYYDNHSLDIHFYLTIVFNVLQIIKTFCFVKKLQKMTEKMSVVRKICHTVHILNNFV